ncbi:MAG: hypothetical protein JNK85_14790 [Verrucomicrobiales bacterium]|nr:hypothetical protein [Verrucomicrobiales bacterium]
MKAMIRGGEVLGRRRTAEEIRSILEWHRQSGLSLLAFARREGLCYATLRRWSAAHDAATRSDVSVGDGALAGRARRGGPGFISVELEAGARADEYIVEWSSGRSLRVPAGFDPNQLRRLLDVLESRS